MAHASDCRKRYVGAACAVAALLLPSLARADEPVLENTLGMRFVRIPPGEFEMGRSEPVETLATRFPRYPIERLRALDDENPVHRVRITKAFYLGQHEVTVGQFRRFVRRSGYVPESVRDGTGGYGYDPDHDPAKSARGDVFAGRDPRYSWSDPGFAQNDDHPVVNVTWNDAIALARWLGEREGAVYRLPTEAEWEYACKAGRATLYPAGDEPESLLGIANAYDAAAAEYWPQWRGFALKASDGFAFTAPVGRFEANAFGVHDMLGNAWEWVSDWYAAAYYASAPQSDPSGPATGSVRVRRGGSWHSWPLYARCTFRNWNTPETRYVLVGMRLVREVQTGRSKENERR